jgi:hypothetical protein
MIYEPDWEQDQLHCIARELPIRSNAIHQTMETQAL